eukprot:CAMPEP_0117652226 /NCGR_PEP_ID=MMETSP0804-20121206/2514_1 /TAXON_ID=1074897 /ORGANISM="Tetraselmis astigmatica, Strain CCMP880" /LENGTH=276 /DNA_ID=CAMNT_0005458259 /DNA_START=758 /DNA_END=1589 /DNA_ORIENTATION=-
MRRGWQAVSLGSLWLGDGGVAGGAGGLPAVVKGGEGPLIDTLEVVLVAAAQAAQNRLALVGLQADAARVACGAAGLQEGIHQILLLHCTRAVHGPIADQSPEVVRAQLHQLLTGLVDLGGRSQDGLCHRCKPLLVRLPVAPPAGACLLHPAARHAVPEALQPLVHHREARDVCPQPHRELPEPTPVLCLEEQVEDPEEDEGGSATPKRPVAAVQNQWSSYQSLGRAGSGGGGGGRGGGADACGAAPQKGISRRDGITEERRNSTSGSTQFTRPFSM